MQQQLICLQKLRQLPKVMVSILLGSLVFLLSLNTKVAFGEEMMSYNKKLSDNMTFNGVAYLTNRSEYDIFEAELMPFDFITSAEIIDPDHEFVWSATERPQAIMPDVFYENERGDGFTVRKGTLGFYRADFWSIYGEIDTRLSILTGASNYQQESWVAWNSQRNPSTSLPLESVDGAENAFLTKAFATACALIEKLQIDQEAILVSCELTRVGKAEYYIMCFGLTYDDVIVYGPTEQYIPFVRKDESFAGMQEYIQVILGDNGIYYLDAMQILRRCSDISKATIMPFDKALSALVSLLAFDKEEYNIRQAWLSYVPVGDAYLGNVQFRPFWCFFMECEEDHVKYVCTARVDAITGEVLW